MVTFVKSTYPGSDKQYVVSGVRLLHGPDKDGFNTIRLQLAGTNLEFDIDVDYSVAQGIQHVINEASGVKEPVNDAPFDITEVNIKDLLDELVSRFNEE